MWKTCIASTCFSGTLPDVQRRMKITWQLLQNLNRQECMSS